MEIPILLGSVSIARRMEVVRAHTSGVYLCLLLWLAHVDVALSYGNTAPPLKPGIVVEWLTENSQAEKIGIQPGDILLTWARGEAHGKFESPFDLPYVRFEWASRGAVQIEGLRGAQRKHWTLGSDTWGIAARPNLLEPLSAIYLQGQRFVAAKKIEEAEIQFRRATALAENSSRPWLSTWFLMRVAQILFDAHNYDASDRAYGEAIERSHAANPIVTAELLRQRGSGFSYREDFVNAEKCYLQASVEWQRLGSETMSLSTSFNAVGSIALLQGDISKAEGYFRHALTIEQHVAPQSVQIAWSLGNLGAVLQARGDLEGAEHLHRMALSHAERYFSRSRTHVQTLRNVGMLASQRGNFTEAESLYRRSLAMAEKLDSSNRDEIAAIIGYLSECLLDEGDSKTAEQYERRALSIRQSLSPGSLSVAMSYRNLGKIARLRGDLNRAEKYYQQALEIGERLAPLSLETCRFLIGLGYIARDRGSFSLAESYYQRALSIMEKDTSGSINHAETLADLAFAKLQQGRPDAAAQLYIQALESLERKITHLGGGEEERSRYRGIHASYYKQYIGLLFAQGNLERAFTILEGSRARTLLEMLSSEQINIHAGVDASLLDREQKLRQSVNASSQKRIRLLNGLHTGQQIASLDVQMTDILHQYHEVEAEIRFMSPKYAALTQPQPLTIGEIQGLLDSDTMLLEYCLGEERSFVWAIGPNSLNGRELPIRAEIEAVARQAYRLMTVRNSLIRKGESEEETERRWRRADAEYSAVAQKLGQILLGPIAGLLNEKRLLIVADGALQYIPFSALPDPNKNGTPLLFEHEIINLPSASVLAELRRAAAGRAQASKAVAIFADPVFDIDDERLRSRPASPFGTLIAQSDKKRSWLPKESLAAERLTRSTSDIGYNRRGRYYLNRLIYSRQEAESIMAVTPRGQGMQVLDFNANRAKALSPALAQYRIIHFATHGLLDSKHPELSGLVFSMVDKHGKPQDGFLQLQDIYNMNLPVELVVLSACDTGLGEEISGEGLIGLTRGFMYAGASRVVASLWSVSDIATSELMARFYKAMEQDKLRPAAALRRAQIEMWKQKRWKSPYYWAAFQLQGEWK